MWLGFSEVLLTNELQVWFLSEYMVNAPLVKTDEPTDRWRAQANQD
jgi:hypothetical protein